MRHLKELSLFALLSRSLGVVGFLSLNIPEEIETWVKSLLHPALKQAAMPGS